MADLRQPAAPRVASGRTLTAVLVGLAVSAIALRVSSPERVAWVQTFMRSSGPS